MRCLVTGAAGFIGSHLAERLAKEGYEVIGVDCFTDYYSREIKEKNMENLLGVEDFTLIEANLLDMDLGQLLEGVDCVFHEAAQGGVRPSWGGNFEIYTENNVLATPARYSFTVSVMRRDSGGVGAALRGIFGRKGCRIVMFGEMPVSYDLQDIDYEELRDFVLRSFVDMWGGEAVSRVEVAHFNPSMIDVTVYVRKRRVEMREHGLRLSKGFRSQGIPTAISVVEEKERT